MGDSSFSVQKDRFGFDVTGPSLICLTGCLLCTPLRGAQPSTAGLQLWLDAADTTTLVSDSSGRLLKWSDKSGFHRDATNDAPESHLQVVPAAMGGRAVVRFDGKGCLCVSASLRAQPGPLTVFIVSQRLASQATGQNWQRLLSSTDGVVSNDSPPNISLLALHDGGTTAYAPRADDREFSDVSLKRMFIGRAASKPTGYFTGDIAEILVYDRVFLSENESRAVLDYLHEKWDAHIAREDSGWTRVGPLPNPPKRITDAYPLSDQQNQGHWIKIEELSDEFDGTSLDPAKWRAEYPGWDGRQPARFRPENVSVSVGQLHLVMQKEELPASLATHGYKDYSSAVVYSVHLAPYGYYELMARPMNSAGSSSFWFNVTEVPDRRTEIDVFEIGGNAPGFERRLNMNLHVWRTPEERRHWNIGGAWLAPWRLADAFHVYGFEWDEKEIKYFVDGVLVRRVNNTHWHDRLHLLFDSETMPSWFGMPADRDLPSTFDIEYVRAWRHRPP
jgi:hypothetical protein